MASQQRTLALKQELVDSLRPVYENGGIAKFNFLNSVDELQRLESQISETRQQLTATKGQAARQVSINSRQILSLEAQFVVTGTTTEPTSSAPGRCLIFQLSRK